MVRGFPQLARKMGQSGKVQGVGKGTRSWALSLPRSKENKVMVSLPSDKSIPRDQREGGRGREEDQSGRCGEGGSKGKTRAKEREERVNPNKGDSPDSLRAPQDWTHTSEGVMGQFGDCSPLGTGSPLLEPPERSE